CDPQKNLSYGRSFISHERNRSGDGCRADGALQYPAKAHCLFLRRLSRLVGRLAARTRERAATRRLSDTEGRKSRISPRDSPAEKGNCGGAGESSAVFPSQFAATERRGVADQRCAQDPGFHRTLCRMAPPATSSMQRVRRTTDFRRSLYRVSPRP